MFRKSIRNLAQRVLSRDNKSLIFHIYLSAEAFRKTWFGRLDCLLKILQYVLSPRVPVGLVAYKIPSILLCLFKVDKQIWNLIKRTF